MNIVAIPAFKDNYIWTIVQKGHAIIVDPGEAAPILNYLSENQLTLDAILLTHKHHDHIGGLHEILAKYPNVVIYGPTEVADVANHIVQDGDTFDLWNDKVVVAKTAGHTEEHISYLWKDALFCGDALFSGGCGRVFTGDYDTSFAGLQFFNTLPDDVHVFAGHEYTMTNLRFAKSVQPDNTAIDTALETVANLLAAGKPSLPTTIGYEKTINLFLQAKNVAAFKALRDLRDNF